MAEGRDSEFLTVHWTAGDYKGAIDYLPWSWFSRDGAMHDLKHEFLGTDGIVYLAHCSIDVSGKTATLNYGGKYAPINERNFCDPGKMKIVFGERSRKAPKELWWKNENDDFESAPIFFGGSEEDIEVQEGGPKLAAHLRRERSLRLRAAKMREVLERRRELRCEACNFSFRRQYGDIGAEFCEVHHRKGLAATGNTVTRPKELAILCSNCHRMIHRTKPMMSVEQFAKRIVQERF
jgi:HNH endonuclease